MTVRRAEILLLLVTLLAAFGWVFSKQALLEFTPYQFIATRFLLAASILTVFCHAELRRLNREQLLRSVTTGAALGLTLLVWVIALQQTPFIGEGAFIVSLEVVMVPLLGLLLFGEPISPRLIVALIPAVVGLACLGVGNGLHFASHQWLFLAATLGFALHLNLSNHFVKQIPSMPLATIQLAVTGFIALLATLFTVGWSTGLSAVSWGWLLSSALIATSLRFAIQTRALQTLMPSHASMIFLAEPVWTAILGALWLHERMSGQQLLGCLLIFTALLIFRADAIIRVLRRRKPPSISNQ